MTTWLNHSYSSFDKGNHRRREGARDGFQGISAKTAGDISVIVEESATYRPEMEWIVAY